MKADIRVVETELGDDGTGDLEDGVGAHRAARHVGLVRHHDQREARVVQAFHGSGSFRDDAQLVRANAEGASDARSRAPR